jgi:hypothetical protein
MRNAMKRLFFWLVAFTIPFVALSADAAVKKDGVWPATDKSVTLDLDGVPRAQALRKLADAAGWSLVLQTSLGADAGDLIDVHVKDQPAGKVLDLVMEDGWVATRDGTLVSMKYATPPPPPPPPPAAPTPSAPDPAEIAARAASAGLPPPPIPLPPTKGDHHGKRKGEDRVLTGGNITVGKDEIVHDVVLFGGNADVYGTVTGDVSITGGNCTIHPGAHVKGDVVGVGGNVTVEDGADIEGDVSVVGGKLQKGDGAQVGGAVVRTDSEETRDAVLGGRDKLRRALSGVGSAITRSAFLFIFGAILLALGSKRMETLRGEVATRPMRSFALGVVGLLSGIVLIIVLCVTVIGIPVAIVGALLAVFAGYAGVIAVLTTVGEALFRHKTQNTYVHLAVGCALFLVASALPWIGGLVTFGVILTGIGVVVATRAAGLVPRKNGVAAGPYRTPA